VQKCIETPPFLAPIFRAFLVGPRCVRRLGIQGLRPGIVEVPAQVGPIGPAVDVRLGHRRVEFDAEFWGLGVVRDAGGSRAEGVAKMVRAPHLFLACFYAITWTIDTSASKQ
jgi:hypothetical protein